MQNAVRTAHRSRVPAKIRNSKAYTKAYRHAPTILTVGGLVLIGGGVVLTWRAALKTQDVLEQRRDKLTDQQRVIDDYGDSYTPDQQKHDRQVIDIQTGVEIAKQIVPPVAMIAAGTFCVMKGHSVLSKRYAAATGALNTVTTLFDQYRQKVVEDQGKEKDLFYRYGIEQDKITEETVGEDGKKHKEKKDILRGPVQVGPDGKIGVDYVFFDESSPYWDKDAYYNLNLVDGVMKECQRFLDLHGWITMDRVLEKLGIWFPEGDPRNELAHKIGWIKNGKRSGGHIDFGIYNIWEEAKRNFVNGYERNVLLEFNHDGYILDLL